MRTVTYGGAVSLDGFLADADGSVDWLLHSKDVQQVMADYWKNVDTILMGRKTYEFAVAHRPPSAKKADKTKSPKRKEPAMRTYVFSHTLREIDYPDAELVGSDAVEFVRKLKERPGEGICLMGGGELAQPLLAAGLVDEIGLNIQPILLGGGIPTFRDMKHRVKLELTTCRTLEHGCVLAQYKVRTDH
jgi:dihydrofolate reductase